jgi:hypothetical protein
MNGTSSNHSLPSASFLSNAFVIFSQKVGEGHFSTVTSVHGVSNAFQTGFFNWGRE